MMFFRLRWLLVLYLLCLAAMVAAVHGPLLDSFFVEDDARNLYIGSRIENWLALFYNRESSLEANNYFHRPLGYLSLWLDGRLFGLNPLGYDLHALALLLAGSLLLVELIRRPSKDSLWAGSQADCWCSRLWQPRRQPGCPRPTWTSSVGLCTSALSCRLCAIGRPGLVAGMSPRWRRLRQGCFSRRQRLPSRWSC